MSASPPPVEQAPLKLSSWLPVALLLLANALLLLPFGSTAAGERAEATRLLQLFGVLGCLFHIGWRALYLRPATHLFVALLRGSLWLAAWLLAVVGLFVALLMVTI
jgi:hypothetical protein